MGQTLVHATCVALTGRAALLRGMTGSGKSDLALRFLMLPPSAAKDPKLVADDQVALKVRDGQLLASAPRPLIGKLEVRGVGILDGFASTREERVSVIVDIDGGRDTERLPSFDRFETLLGVPVPVLALEPFAASAAIKLALILRNLSTFRLAAQEELYKA